MKAMVYEGPGKRSWMSVPDPKIQEPTDIIVKMDATTICGIFSRVIPPRFRHLASSATKVLESLRK